MEVDQKSKIYQARRVSPRARNAIQSKWANFSNRNIFFGELIVEQSNFYAPQHRRNFTITKEELKAFLGINFVMAISKLPKIAKYWRVDNLIGNDSIHNIMIRNRFCEILQNLHLADNRR